MGNGQQRSRDLFACGGGDSSDDELPPESVTGRGTAMPRGRPASPYEPSATSDDDEEPPLPAGWRQARSPDGRTYYYQRGTQRTQWTRPTEPVPPPEPPKPPEPPQMGEPSAASSVAVLAELDEGYDELDIDGDGKLSFDEIELAVSEHATDHRHGEVQRLTERVMRALDHDRDGTVSRAEFKARAGLLPTGWTNAARAVLAPEELKQLASTVVIKRYAATWLLRRRLTSFVRNHGVSEVLSHLQTYDSIRQELLQVASASSINATNLSSGYLGPLRGYFEKWAGTEVDPHRILFQEYELVSGTCMVLEQVARHVYDRFKRRIESGRKLQPIFEEELPAIWQHLAKFMCLSRSIIEAINVVKRRDPELAEYLKELQSDQTPINGQRFTLDSCFFAPLQRLTSYRMICQSLDKQVQAGLHRSNSVASPRSHTTSWSSLVAEFKKVEQKVDFRFSKYMELRRVRAALRNIGDCYSWIPDYEREFVVAVQSWRRSKATDSECEWVALVVLSDMIVVVTEPEALKPRRFDADAIYAVTNLELTRLSGNDWMELTDQFGLDHRLCHLHKKWPPRAFQRDFPYQQLQQLGLKITDLPLPMPPKFKVSIPTYQVVSVEPPRAAPSGPPARPRGPPAASTARPRGPPAGPPARRLMNLGLAHNKGGAHGVTRLTSAPTKMHANRTTTSLDTYFAEVVDI